MVVGMCHVDVLIPENASLKEKRQIVRSLVGRVRRQFNVSIAEVGNHDKWQRCSLGISLVGSDRPGVDAVLARVLNFINNVHTVNVIAEETEILHV